MKSYHHREHLLQLLAEKKRILKEQADVAPGNQTQPTAAASRSGSAPPTRGSSQSSTAE